jgi:hypothetical protein
VKAGPLRSLEATALLVALLARGGAAQQRVDQRRPFEPSGSVRILNPVGRVRVIGWDSDSLAISGTLASGAGRFYAAGTPRVYKLGVDVPLASATPGSAELEVRVPRRASVWVKSATADIEVTGVDGPLDLNSVSGAIHVVGTPQDVTAETMDGTVEVAGGTGRTRVKTVSGGILLRGASEDIGATTLSGAIVVRAAGWQRGGTGVQRGSFASVTGDIHFAGDVGRGGVLELESQSGTIDVRVPATTVADFDLLTIGGTITNGLTQASPERRAVGVGYELRFSTGTGGAQVTARTFKGPIRLQPKP